MHCGGPCMALLRVGNFLWTRRLRMCKSTALEQYSLRCCTCQTSPQDTCRCFCATFVHRNPLCRLLRHYCLLSLCGPGCIGYFGASHGTGGSSFRISCSNAWGDLVFAIQDLLLLPETLHVWQECKGEHLGPGRTNKVESCRLASPSVLAAACKGGY